MNSNAELPAAGRAVSVSRYGIRQGET